jgi:hypothetical protein
MTIKSLVFSLAILLGFVLSNMAHADSIVMKAYKKDFPEEQLKCMNCHMAAYPWHHPWNAYGQTVKKAINAAGVADKPTTNDINKIADILKQIGKSEDFKGTTVKQ